jgi:nitroimidazol reductase NimA-like FMN-containing flavoprotein (pyridoxamine 5'-phosphate oxidase superfamily)
MIKPDTKAQAILDRINYITLATVSNDGQPWNSPVYCAYDEDYSVYWGSHIDSQHSQNIRANSKAFIVVYDSTVAPGLGSGVYMQASCTDLTDPEEIAAAHKLIQDRRPNPYWKLSEVQADRPVHLFKAVPQKIWMNGDGEKDGQYIDVRVEAEN